MQDCSYKFVMQFGLVTSPTTCFYLFNRLGYLKKNKRLARPLH